METELEVQGAFGTTEPVSPLVSEPVRSTEAELLWAVESDPQSEIVGCDRSPEHSPTLPGEVIAYQQHLLVHRDAQSQLLRFSALPEPDRVSLLALCPILETNAHPGHELLQPIFVTPPSPDRERRERSALEQLVREGSTLVDQESGRTAYLALDTQDRRLVHHFTLVRPTLPGSEVAQGVSEHTPSLFEGTMLLLPLEHDWQLFFREPDPLTPNDLEEIEERYRAGEDARLLIEEYRLTSLTEQVRSHNEPEEILRHESLVRDLVSSGQGTLPWDNQGTPSQTDYQRTGQLAVSFTGRGLTPEVLPLLPEAATADSADDDSVIAAPSTPTPPDRPDPANPPPSFHESWDILSLLGLDHPKALRHEPDDLGTPDLGTSDEESVRPYTSNDRESQKIRRLVPRSVPDPSPQKSTPRAVILGDVRVPTRAVPTKQNPFEHLAALPPRSLHEPVLTHAGPGSPGINTVMLPLSPHPSLTTAPEATAFEVAVDLTEPPPFQPHAPLPHRPAEVHDLPGDRSPGSAPPQPVPFLPMNPRPLVFSTSVTNRPPVPQTKEQRPAPDRRVPLPQSPKRILVGNPRMTTAVAPEPTQEIGTQSIERTAVSQVQIVHGRAERRRAITEQGRADKLRQSAGHSGDTHVSGRTAEREQAPTTEQRESAGHPSAAISGSTRVPVEFRKKAAVEERPASVQVATDPGAMGTRSAERHTRDHRVDSRSSTPSAVKQDRLPLTHPQLSMSPAPTQTRRAVNLSRRAQPLTRTSHQSRELTVTTRGATEELESVIQRLSGPHTPSITIRATEAHLALRGVEAYRLHQLVRRLTLGTPGPLRLSLEPKQLVIAPESAQPMTLALTAHYLAGLKLRPIPGSLAVALQFIAPLGTRGSAHV
ncbi:hypothetical protein HY375_01625 [Candidatus Berkelbacteria bacterium]|nr:hypothetical protein [Candidatus Berkelbacteria bacterium]